MAAADALIRYPLNPAFMSLNLAQAVMIMAYEWWTASDDTPPRTLMTNETQVATKGKLDNFLAHLVDQCFGATYPNHPDLDPQRKGAVVTTAELRIVLELLTE